MSGLEPGAPDSALMAAVLREIGCRWHQGYVFAAALFPEQIDEMLEVPLAG